MNTHNCAVFARCAWKAVHAFASQQLCPKGLAWTGGNRGD